MMKKIVHLPLDERPCNYNFPFELFNPKAFFITRPDELGDKKSPANPEKIANFLIKNCINADGLVISMDTLLYGGLIPSRLHFLSKEEVEKRLAILKTIKEQNPSIKIYAFQCIMRCPKYSSSDEEPDYYEICGEQIHNAGVLTHKVLLNLAEQSELDNIINSIQPEYLNDYKKRREFNLKFNLETLKLADEGIIDFLIIPQDDSAAFGFTALDQQIIRSEISSKLLQRKVLMYPGADEIALTLMSKFYNHFNQYSPKVYIKYSSIHAEFIIPSYEDRSLGETIKYQILASGCTICSSLNEADFVLAINSPGSDMTESIFQPSDSSGYTVERNITEFISFIESCIDEGIPVTIGDIAYANGGDLELIALLNQSRLLTEINGYAGWNTSSNTLGTAISQGVYSYYCETNYNFLGQRYVEDVGYCSVVRKDVSANILNSINMDYYDIKEKDGEAAKIIKSELEKFVINKLSSISEKIIISKVIMPWRRMFEVDVHVSFKE